MSSKRVAKVLYTTPFGESSVMPKADAEAQLATDLARWSRLKSLGLLRRNEVAVGEPRIEKVPAAEKAATAEPEAESA